MTFTRTEQLLSQITDQGLFEKLAMAILRAAEPDYRAMVHTGVNADGKTIKSPADGILYHTSIDPPRLYVVYHTTTTTVARLRRKWLHDPATVKPRRGNKPTAPEGDVLNAISLIADQRRQISNLKATVVLTTNEEPDITIVSDVAMATQHASIDIDIWQRSRLADFLDTTPHGQWLRRQYLGIDSDILSRDLLLDLSKTSITIHAPRDVPQAWVARELDESIAVASQRETTFLIAPSGFGKSIAAYKWITAHIAGGGAGLVLSHDGIASALTIDDAIDAALHKLYPSLAPGSGTVALALSSVDRPIYLTVEDINHSGQAALLAERIEGWARVATGNRANSRQHYRLLCPIWPEVLASMGDEARKVISALAIVGSPFTAVEGGRAVQKRAELGGRRISDMAANAASAALGHDPLLIALYDPSKAAAPNRAIGDFVEGVLGRVALAHRDHAATDYRESLRRFAGAILLNKILNPLWRDLRHWAGIDARDLHRLAHLMHEGNLLHLIGASEEQRVGYRHDRVRDWLLIDAAEQFVGTGMLAGAIVEEPYFAEVVGGVLARGQVEAAFLFEVRKGNPLALFHALRSMIDPESEPYRHVVAAIEEWLADPSANDRSNLHLHWEALGTLAETEGPDVIRLVHLFKHLGWTALLARFRNGDVVGGIQFCATIEPGTGAVWRDIQIEHAKHKFGRNLVLKLSELLRLREVDASFRVGALRLAGHVADPALSDAIAICWELDSQRDQHLAEYLWAAAECCGTEAERYLKPVCEAWAALPSSTEGKETVLTRDNLAADHVRWAFRRWVPREAIQYFVKRAESEDLRWPITYMLSEVDDPIAVGFVVREIADMERRTASANGLSPFASMLPGSWRRHQEERGVGMSEVSRLLLQTLWTDPSTDKHLRGAALRLWGATHTPTDLALLRDPTLSAGIADIILLERLRRADRDAIPELLEKIKEPESGWGWWNTMRPVWSDDLVGILGPVDKPSTDRV